MITAIFVIVEVFILLKNSLYYILLLFDTLFRFRAIHYFVVSADDVILFAQSEESMQGSPQGNQDIIVAKVEIFFRSKCR